MDRCEIVSRCWSNCSAMAAKDSSATLKLIHQTISEGSDAGQIAEQLLGYFRDMMAVRVGCDENTLLSCSPSDMEGLQTLADKLGLETILSCVQVLDQAMVRMQSSLHARTLLEVAAVRVCNLEHLDSVGDLIKQLSSAQGGMKTAKPPAKTTSKPPVKKNEVAENQSQNATPQRPSEGAPDSSSMAQRAGMNAKGNGAGVASAAASVVQSAANANQAIVSPGAPADKAPGVNLNEPKVAPEEPTSTQAKKTGDIEKTWKQALASMGPDDLTSEMASQYERLEWKSPERLIVTMADAHNSEACSKQERRERLELALASVTGQKIRIDFVTSEAARKQAIPEPRMTRTQQIRELQNDTYVRQTMDLFDAEVMNFYKRSP